MQEEYIQSRQWFEIKTLWYLGRYGLPRGTSPNPDSTFIASLDWSAFLIVAMSLAATFICLRYGWKANEPLTLLGVVLVLPISFGCAPPATPSTCSISPSLSHSMSFASERREVFLLDCASMKASVIGLWFVLRDWTESFKKAKRAYPDEFVSIADCTLEDITVYIEHRGARLAIAHLPPLGHPSFTRAHTTVARHTCTLTYLLMCVYMHPHLHTFACLSTASLPFTHSSGLQAARNVSTVCTKIWTC